jgi:hypothetical protein
MALFKKDEEGRFWMLNEVSGLRTRWHSPGKPSHDYQPGDLRKFEIYEADGFEDFVMTCHLKPSLDNGWIDRAGRFWGCDFHSHHRVIYDVLKTDVAAAEQAGWVKVEPYQWLCLKQSLSPEQEMTLFRIGRDKENPRFRDMTVTFEQAFPFGYRMKQLPKHNAVRVYPDTPPTRPKPTEYRL